MPQHTRYPSSQIPRGPLEFDETWKRHLLAVIDPERPTYPSVEDTNYINMFKTRTTELQNSKALISGLSVYGSSSSINVLTDKKEETQMITAEDEGCLVEETDREYEDDKTLLSSPAISVQESIATPRSTLSILSLTPKELPKRKKSGKLATKSPLTASTQRKASYSSLQRDNAARPRISQSSVASPLIKPARVLPSPKIKAAATAKPLLPSKKSAGAVLLFSKRRSIDLTAALLSYTDTHKPGTLSTTRPSYLDKRPVASDVLLLSGSSPVPSKHLSRTGAHQALKKTPAKTEEKRTSRLAERPASTVQHELKQRRPTVLSLSSSKASDMLSPGRGTRRPNADPTLAKLGGTSSEQKKPQRRLPGKQKAAAVAQTALPQTTPKSRSNDFAPIRPKKTPTETSGIQASDVTRQESPVLSLSGTGSVTVTDAEEQSPLPSEASEEPPLQQLKSIRRQSEYLGQVEDDASSSHPRLTDILELELLCEEVKQEIALVETDVKANESELFIQELQDIADTVLAQKIETTQPIPLETFEVIHGVEPELAPLIESSLQGTELEATLKAFDAAKQTSTPSPTPKPSVPIKKQQAKTVASPLKHAAPAPKPTAASTTGLRRKTEVKARPSTGVGKPKTVPSAVTKRNTGLRRHPSAT